jgi:toxin YoeB
LKITFTDKGWSDYTSWLNEDKKVLKRINTIIKNITETPFDGIGKPEPLKFNLQGFWSRRIDREHRIVYKIDGENLIIISCKFHYE